MELHINDKIEFNSINETRVYVAKTNTNCTRLSTFTIVFKDGKITESFENYENRIGEGLKLFKTDLDRLQKTGLDNLNKWDYV